MIENIMNWIRQGFWQGVVAAIPVLTMGQLRYLVSRLEDEGLLDRLADNVPISCLSKLAGVIK